MFSTFPHFDPIRLDMREDYNKFYKQFDPYSDFSFGNLIIWLNQYGDLGLSELNGNVVIECHNLFDQGKYMLTMIGQTEVDKTLEAMFSYLREKGEKPELPFLPEVVVKHMRNPDRYEISEDRSSANYILSAEKLSNLRGSECENLRKQVKRFEKQYAGRFEVVEIDLQSSEGVRTLVNGMHIWDTIYTHNDLERQESHVINTALANAGALGFKNLSVLVDGHVQAMALYQNIPQPEYIVCNHMKVNFHYRYISTYLTYALAKRLYASGVPHMNFEQDLGIPGLREHKLRLKPVDFLKIYSVSLRPN